MTSFPVHFFVGSPMMFLREGERLMLIVSGKDSSHGKMQSIKLQER